MAGDRLSWVFELFDKMSGPAASMNRQISQLNMGLESGKGSASGFGSTISMTGANLGGWVTVAEGAYEVVKGLAEGFFELAKGLGEAAFHQFAFKESSLAAMKTLYGSADVAERMFNLAIDYSKKTAAPVDSIVESFTRLKGVGFANDEIPVVYQGLQDIASASGRGAFAIQHVTLAMSEMMGQGQMNSRVLRMLEIDTGGIINKQNMMAKVALIAGVSTEEAGHMMENGTVSARVGAMALMQIAKDLGGGVIGQHSIDQAKTLGGLWQILQNQVDNLFLTMDLSKAGWFTTVKGFLSNLVEALDTSSAAGKTLQAVFDRIFAGFSTDFLSEWIGSDGLEGMNTQIGKLALAFEAVFNIGTAAFKGLWAGLREGFGPLVDGLSQLDGSAAGLENTKELFREYGVVIADLVTGLAAMGSIAIAIVTPFQWLGSSLKGLWDALVGITDGLARLLGGGLAEGLLSGWVDASSAMNEGGNNLITGFKKLFGIASPSSVFEDMGGDVAMGFQQGVEGGIGGASLAVNRLTGAEARTGGGKSGGLSAGPVSITIQVNGAGESGESIAQQIANLLPSALARAFGQMATEAGA